MSAIDDAVKGVVDGHIVRMAFLDMVDRVKTIGILPIQIGPKEMRDYSWFDWGMSMPPAEDIYRNDV